MDIRKLQPMTQSTLRRQDYNGDGQVSRRELSYFTAAAKHGDRLIGIAPQDQAQVREFLTQPASLAPSIPLFEDEKLPPGYTLPAPLFADSSLAKPEKASKGAKTKGRAPKAIKQDALFQLKAKTKKGGDPETSSSAGAGSPDGRQVSGHEIGSHGSGVQTKGPHRTAGRYRPSRADGS